jgi:hypothetical protein
MVGTPTTMQMADVAGYTPATIQTTPAPIIPREIRQASNVSLIVFSPFCAHADL